MSLNEQLTNLLREAPRYGVPEVVMQEIVIPVITLFAKQLQHLNYYILQTAEGDWLLNILNSRQNPELEKTVVYAFADYSDAMSSSPYAEANTVATPIPVAQILLQLFAFEQVDSIIFWETPGDLTKGSEIPRSELQSLIEDYLNRVSSSNLPPDIA